MSRVILNEEKYSQLSGEIISCANTLLRDEGDYLDSITKLSSLCHEVGENDNDFNVFVVISSETDHIPYGASRKNCSNKWLAQCDKELLEVKQFYKLDLKKSCESIIEKFTKNA